MCVIKNFMNAILIQYFVEIVVQRFENVFNLFSFFYTFKKTMS